MTAAADPFAGFKAAQREGWSVFAPVEIFTIMPAAKLVKFAQIAEGQRVLDVGSAGPALSRSPQRAVAPRYRGST